MCACFSLCLCVSKRQKDGVMRESNSRPPAPKAGIIPLDQSPTSELPTSVRGLVVMIVACQVMDPGSIPGERIFLCRRPADRTKKEDNRSPWGDSNPQPPDPKSDALSIAPQGLVWVQKETTTVGFEPTRAKPINLAG